MVIKMGSRKEKSKEEPKKEESGEDFGIVFDDPIWLDAIDEWRSRTYPEQ